LTKKILTFWILVSMFLVTSLGCQTASNKEIVKKALENFSQAKSYQYSGNASIKLDLPNDNTLPPDEKFYIQMFNNLNFKFNGSFIKEKETTNSNFAISIPLNNMELKLSGYQKGDDIWFRYPILPTFIHINLKEINKEKKVSPQNSKELNKLILELVNKIASSIKENKFTAEKVDGDVGKETKITVKLDKEDLRNIFQMIYDFSRSPEVKNTLLGSLQDTEDETKSNSKQEVDNFKKFQDNFNKNVEVRGFTLSFNVSNNTIREQKVNLDLKSPDQELKQDAVIKVDSMIKYRNVNGNFTIKYPDFSKEGVTELKELQDQGSIFGGPDDL
jgi:hypothetical protein